MWKCSAASLLLFTSLQHSKTHLLPSFSLSLSLLIVGVGLLALFVLNHEDIKQ